MQSTAVLDSRSERLTTNQAEASLLLVTCYPFDALLPGGPLRFVVTARPRVPIVIPQTAALEGAAADLAGGLWKWGL